MIFTIAFGYFYTISQDQQVLQKATVQHNNLLSERSEESLYIVGSAIGGNLTFAVNNTGISTTLVAYFIYGPTGNILLYKNGESSPTSCSTTAATVPCEINQGASAVFTTLIPYTGSSTYTMKVITSRGTTVVGTYPTEQITSSSVNAIVASGLGSLQMVFSSFTFYTYSSTGGPWKINFSSAQSAAISPYNIQIAISAKVTNNDPSGGTIVVGSHTSVWTFVSCSSGCGGQALIFFYVMNVGSDGTISSTSQNSFAPIEIPYGATKTIYFGSANDLSQGSYAAQSINDQIGEHDVFMIFSGSLVAAKNSTLYSQNLPFAATFTSDNIGSMSESPTTCGNGTASTFSLDVSNTPVTPSGDGISQVTLQTSSFSGISASAPAGWTYSISSGTITWKASSSSYYIQESKSLTFTWSGTSPIVTAGDQVIFPSVITWASGTIVNQPMSMGCFVS